MAAPVATWSSGGPVVTFPDGCLSPARIHLAFTTPTFDRSPGHIPVTYGEETLGAVTGACIPTTPPVTGYELAVPQAPIVAGALPTIGGPWLGAGATIYDVYVDGVRWLDGNNFYASPTPGTAVSVDLLLSNGIFAVDWTAAHAITLRTVFADVPAYRTWDTFGGISVICLPIADQTSPATPVYPWAIDRANLWAAGFDPGGGFSWGPFGTAVPTFQLVHLTEYFPPWATPLARTEPAVSYPFTSPSRTVSCGLPAGFYDPAAGATVGTNAAPGTGGNPVGYGGSSVSTFWGCSDGRSFKINPTTPGSAPYTDNGPGDQPAYVEFSPSPGGSYDVSYYQSMVLYLPPGFTAFSGEDTWLVMGVRSDPASGPSAWSDLTTGLALKQRSGLFSVQSFFGSPDGNLGAVNFYGTDVSIQAGFPHCLRLYVKRNSDTSGTTPFHFWQYQVDATLSALISTRSLYNRPTHPVWGLLDNYLHQGFGGGHPTIYYVDDLRYDTSPVGCNCRPFSLVMKDIQSKLSLTP